MQTPFSFLRTMIFLFISTLGTPALAALVIEEITVTAQKRQVSLQDTALSVTALTGETLEKDRNLSFADLARSITGFSYTGNTIFDQELNIRGVTNTRVDAPTADPSVGVFVDGVYVGRTGLMNMDMYDVERVEVIRGPQGVLIGKNVVGGAMSILSKAPEEDRSGSLSVSYGNFDTIRATGYVTGGLGKNGWAGRLSFQHHQHDGYARDVLNNRDMEDLSSTQFRAQLQYAPTDSDLKARLLFDYFDDESNGPASIALDSRVATGLKPWSRARTVLSQLRGAPLGIRETAPPIPIYAGDAAPTPPQQQRDGWNLILDVEFGWGENIVVNSITGYRDADGFNLYDQTGIGPRSGVPAFPRQPTLLFSFPVNEEEGIEQFSQELRFSSANSDSRFDWIIGAYYQHDDVSKFDRFLAETPWGFLAPTLTGESHWNNGSTNESMAVFGQAGFRFNERWKITVGARYTRDKKEGAIRATAVATGDRYNPADPTPLTPLNVMGFSTSYEKSWSELTPQAIIEFSPNEDVLTYFNISKGYKGGGWEDTPPNAAATNSAAAFDPEVVTSYELGGKIDFLDSRARLNSALFYMDYEDLQVAQTNQACLCNIIDNAANAKILGIETEFTIAVTDNLFAWLNASWLDTEYKDFVESSGADRSGNFLQRTPKYQLNVGGELTMDIGQWAKALTIRANYTHQGVSYWVPANVESERPYGLFDARISFAPPGSGWFIAAWGKNLTNQEYRNHVIPFFGDEVSFFAPPRTYGIDVGYSF